MKKSNFIALSSRPYSFRLQETNISGKTFSSRQLAFNMQSQTQTNWCWAATATSVSHFYSSISEWTQCKLAGEELEQTNCCCNPVPSLCNVTWYLEKALSRTNNFVTQITGIATFQQVCDEIDAGRPVGARIGWQGGGGHFLVIYGYSLIDSVEYFDIDDPIYGKNHMTVMDFSSNYQGFGFWTHTYFTQHEIDMTIRYLTPSDSILKRVLEIRPLLTLKNHVDFNNVLFHEENSSLGMSHRIYSISLDSLLNDQTPMIQPTSMRVYEMVGDNPRAFFDLSEDNELSSIQMSASATHLEPFMLCLDKALSMIKKSKADCELRLLRIPALNFEAVWISYDDNAKDFILPLREHGKLLAYTSIPIKKALVELKNGAKLLKDVDDSMGG
ncbi:TPA: papain-like cysteine protease family protein [Raoultella planticola]